MSSRLFRNFDLVDDDGQYHVPDPELVELACKIADLFVDYSSSSSGKPVRVSRKHAVHFYNAAAICKSMELTPEAFVARQVEGMLKTGCLWPSGIASQVFLNVVDTSSNLTADSVAYYKSQVALFTEMSKLYGPVSAIKDRANDFSPLFRVALAIQLKLPDIISEYAEQARSEYAASPAAKDVFPNVLGFLNGNTSSNVDRKALPPSASADGTLPSDSGSC